MTTRIDHLLGIVTGNLVVLLIVRRTGHLVTCCVVGVVVQRVTTSLQSQTGNHGISSLLGDTLGSSHLAILIRIHILGSMLQVGNQSVADLLTRCDGRIQVVSLISRLQREGNVAPIAQQLMIEHSTHHLGLTHHLGHVSHLRNLDGSNCTVSSLRGSVFGFLSIDTAVLKIEDELIGRLHSRIKAIPEFLHIAGI